MTPEPFILCDNLVKIYKVENLEVVALQGLDLAVAPGELVGIIGASGSGKSTLMNILGGLDRPSAGRVWVGGRNLLELSDSALTDYRRTQAGFVWQQGARNLIPYLTAQENIELPLVLAGVPAQKSRGRATDLLEAVGLTERRHHYLQQISGGEQQRVAIAVALANEPALLLADEPTGEVDTTTAATIYKAFHDLNQQFNVTTLIVSHDPGITRHVDRVVAIRDGRTSSETIRIETPIQHTLTGGEHPSETQHEITYQELVVLDSAGRLQIPKEYLDRFQISGRARLEITEKGILICSAPTSDLEQSAKVLVVERSVSPQQVKGLRAWFQRRKQKRDGRVR
jgi:putative ABC transport system ATP-binding protein